MSSYPNLSVILMIFSLSAILIVFILYGFDIRKKDGMTPFVNKNLINLMKFSCAILVSLYIWSLFGIAQVGKFEWASFALTGSGALLVMNAKIQLRDSFSWTGHFLKDTKLITDGIYQYIRNPLYTGVFLFEAGAVLNFLINGVLKSSAAIPLLILGTITLLYAVFFNITMALQESSKLEEQFGEEYRYYKSYTGMFFPKPAKLFGGLQK